MAQTTGPWFSATCLSLAPRPVQQKNVGSASPTLVAGAGFDLDRVQCLQPWRGYPVDAMLVFLIPLTATMRMLIPK